MKTIKFTTPTEIPCCFNAEIVFKMTEVLPDDGGPEKTIKFMNFLLRNERMHFLPVLIKWEYPHDTVCPIPAI